MLSVEWEYLALLVTPLELAELRKTHTQDLPWPPQGGKQVVIFPVHGEQAKALRLHPGYKADNLADLRENHPSTLAFYVEGHKLDPDGFPAIPSAYAGQHKRSQQRVQAERVE